MPRKYWQLVFVRQYMKVVVFGWFCSNIFATSSFSIVVHMNSITDAEFLFKKIGGGLSNTKNQCCLDNFTNIENKIYCLKNWLYFDVSQNIWKTGSLKLFHQMFIFFLTLIITLGCCTLFLIIHLPLSFPSSSPFFSYSFFSSFPPSSSSFFSSSFLLLLLFIKLQNSL